MIDFSLQKKKLTKIKIKFQKGKKNFESVRKYQLGIKPFWDNLTFWDDLTDLKMKTF